MSRPFASVLIDTYNHERFIEEAIVSVLQQDFPELLLRIGPVPEALQFQADEYLFTMAAVFGEALILRQSFTFYRYHQDNFFQVGNQNPQPLRRKQGILATLAELLSARLSHEGVLETGVAFEADPEIAARLRQNADRNKFGWRTVTEAAVWSEPHSIFFQRADPRVSPDRGLGHIAEITRVDTIEVQAISLDDFAHSAPPPDFIKCDVEGAELEVLRGALQLLAKNRPAIRCEVHTESIRRTLLDRLSAAQYSCKDCGQRHILALPS
jgi:FkbM family methyltransferase